MDEIKVLLSDYDTYISSDVGNPMEQTIKSEMVVVLEIAIFIIVAVLLFTSNTYMEIPVLLITFGAAALLNMGTNYWFGTISYVTDSIAVVLQLALAIDYAIILCHRYTEERERMEARDAARRGALKGDTGDKCLEPDDDLRPRGADAHAFPARL